MDVFDVVLCSECVRSFGAVVVFRDCDACWSSESLQFIIFFLTSEVSFVRLVWCLKPLFCGGWHSILSFISWKVIVFLFVLLNDGVEELL